MPEVFDAEIAGESLEAWSDPDWGDDPFADLDRDPPRRPPRPRRRRRGQRGDAARLARTGIGRLLYAVVLGLLALTIVGLVALWPGAEHSSGTTQAFGGSSLPATVNQSSLVRCPGPVATPCRRIQVTLNGGPDEGGQATITLGPEASTPDVAPGSSIRVTHVGAPPEGAPAGHVETYQFADYDRTSPLIWLAIAFGVLVLLLARWRGLLALIGLGLSLFLVMRFLVPAMLAGSSPLLVSLVGALAVMFLTVGLTNGIGAQSLAAALGIGGSLLLAAGLADAYAHIAHLNGLNSELSVVMQQSGLHVSLQGIVIAGIVIGALGALSDMAVTQASAVMALRRANSALTGRDLYRDAFVVGRDHLAATINTLVLAYAGAALPLLLILSGVGVGTTDALNAQDVAEPLVATLVGSIGLITAVPLTTALAAFLATRVPPDAIPEHAHAH